MIKVEFFEQTKKILFSIIKEREEGKRRIEIGYNCFTIYC